MRTVRWLGHFAACAAFDNGVDSKGGQRLQLLNSLKRHHGTLEQLADRQVELGQFGFADEGLHSGDLTELVEVVHGSLLAQLRLPNNKLLQEVRAQSHHGRENLRNSLRDRPPSNHGRGQAKTREVTLGGEEVAGALLELLLKLQLEVAEDFLLALSQKRWHALHNPSQEERLLHGVLKVFCP